MNYQQEYQHSIDSPEEFWQGKAQSLDWFTPPTAILSQDDNGSLHWFADGKMNTCHMALDHQVATGRGEQTALIYDSPVTQEKKQYTYQQLLDEVSLCAGMLSQLGVSKGDRVVIYMPMIPEAVIAMLACARLGAIHSVVFGGFAAPELAKRIDDAQPKVVISASCGIEVNKIIEYKTLLDKTMDIAEHQPQHCIIFQRPQFQADITEGRDLVWQELIKTASPVDCVHLSGDDLLYILYTSGTTGKPKGVVRENGGHAVALKYSMKAVYDIDPGDVFWAASDVGWVVGHSYIVYAPLLQGATTVLYEGKPVMTPDAGAFWRVIEEYQVKALFTAPTAFRAIKKEDPTGSLAKKYDTSSLKTLFSAGERLDPSTHQWLTDLLDVPVIDNWWQTETGWPIAANFQGIEPMPIKSGSATMPGPGYQIHILNEKGESLPAGEQGNIAIKLPLPPCCLSTIWQNFEGYQQSYLSTYKGYYFSGDRGYLDEDGYLFVMGRTDDVINVAGHRLSTGEMEEAIAHHASIAECAVIGRDDELKGQLPVGLLVLKSGETIDEESLSKEVIQNVREAIGAVAAFKEVYIVPRLPKTRSGKVLRQTIRKIFNKQDYTIPSTIEDPSALDEIEELIS